MLLLDTCAIIFDALDPSRLSHKAATAINQADSRGTLACSDISLWELAMLVAKGRLNPGTDTQTLLQLILTARNIRIVPISPEIAAKSAQPDLCPHGDPADRIIAATALLTKAKLVTSDKKLAEVSSLTIVW